MLKALNQYVEIFLKIKAFTALSIHLCKLAHNQFLLFFPRKGEKQILWMICEGGGEGGGEGGEARI